jgi:hypothetical protein
MNVTIHADVYTRSGAYGITCRRPECDFKGWGWLRGQVFERLAEHAQNECPWTEESSDAE